MACNTCNDCGNTSPCGCKDHGLTTPCSYSDCGPVSERCEGATCAECVEYCESSFQIVSEGGILKVNTGERLDLILQKFAMMIVNGVGTCTADNLHHGPYNIYNSAITATTVNVIWGGVSNQTTSVNVYFDDYLTPVGWTLANVTPLIGVFNYIITGLTPATAYKIKVSAFNPISGYCDSVELLIATPAL